MKKDVLKMFKGLVLDDILRNDLPGNKSIFVIVLCPSLSGRHVYLNMTG